MIVSVFRDRYRFSIQLSSSLLLPLFYSHSFPFLFRLFCSNSIFQPPAASPRPAPLGALRIRVSGPDSTIYRGRTRVVSGVIVRFYQFVLHFTTLRGCRKEGIVMCVCVCVREGKFFTLCSEIEFFGYFMGLVCWKLG